MSENYLYDINNDRNFQMICTALADGSGEYTHLWYNRKIFIPLNKMLTTVFILYGYRSNFIKGIG